MKNLVPLFIMVLLAGCVNQYGLTDEQAEDAYVKYPHALVCTKNDTSDEHNKKVWCRIGLGIITVGFDEVIQRDKKSESCHWFWFDTFIGKTKRDVIAEFGVPDKTFTDDGGEVISYRVDGLEGDVSGGGYGGGGMHGSVSSWHRETTFFLDQNGIVTKWKYKKE